MPSTGGLDYSDIQTLPIRGAVVEAVDGAGTSLAETLSSETGTYSLTVPAGTDMRVRVLSRTEDPAGNAADWDLRITDNTSANALYALRGSLASSGSTDSTRDLKANVGADAQGNYTGARQAAPFSILDDVYTAIQTVVDVDADAVLPSVEIRWSVNNRSSAGDQNLENGDIGTSFYRSGNDRAVYLLGQAGVDSDEFDSSVITHEWGHYFEDQLSRADSIGGSHSLNSLLDPRVALGEGFGNAFSAIALGDPTYRDSAGERDQGGFSFSLERNGTSPGWYKESSVQSILYDIADDQADAGDTLSEGFAPIYEALTAADYKATPAFTTIFSLAESVRDTSPGISAGLDALLQRESIRITDSFATGETNNGGVGESLPIYRDLTVGGPAVAFCSIDDAGTYNRLGNRQFFRMDTTTAGNVTLTLTNTSKPTGTTSDPDYYVYRDGALVDIGGSGDPDLETTTFAVEADTYLIDAVEFNNGRGAPSGEYCFTMTAR